MRARIALVALALAFAAGCGGEPKAPDPAQVPVVATSEEVADFVAAVAGRRAAVRIVLRPGDQRQAVLEAKAVFRAGGPGDAWVARLRPTAPRRPTVDLSRSVVLRERRGEVEQDWWRDPQNVRAALLRIRDSLVKVDPTSGGPYRTNADRYGARVQALDRALARCLAPLAVPAARRPPEPGYFAGRYRLARRPELPGRQSGPNWLAAQARLGDLAARMLSGGRLRCAVAVPPAVVTPVVPPAP